MSMVHRADGHWSCSQLSEAVPLQVAGPREGGQGAGITTLVLLQGVPGRVGKARSRRGTRGTCCVYRKFVVVRQTSNRKQALSREPCGQLASAQNPGPPLTHVRRWSM